MDNVLYVLTRTSGRPTFYARMRESVRALTWPHGVVHVVHSDDPRDTYAADCDVLVKGECHGPYMGSGYYNLYNNRLLEVVPKDCWVAFIDDDDEYAAPDVFERLIDTSKPGKIHTGQVSRGADKIWNTDPHAKKREFQTECFVVRGSIAKKATWWGEKGGDHYYTRRLVRHASTVWHEVLIAQAQEGKGHGVRADIGGVVVDLDSAMSADAEVWVKMYSGAKRRSNAGKLVRLRYREAREIERAGYGQVTYKGVTVCR